ncbi:metal ABC transporter solute-binding protein, Zn/Mn family [Sulfurovum sp.]|uniref:metal ABC transporter solute-binding protein, Zn/Mn family n=1 Tax=Sulfurovum sp. TaxID=1969726 RepID=UPI002867DD95|nr:zinc ABC transporter substrate-binding protein [Sulfurovum sp.]
MNKITLIFLLSTTYIFSNINAIVSILPQQTFVKAIGGDKVNVALMVQPGNSPHTYEPKPSQMIDIAKAELYFAIDVEFEDVWLPKFKNLNSNMQVIDLAKNVTKIEMQTAHEEKSTDEGHDGHAHHDAHNHEGADPHIWTAPSNVKIIAQNIFDALSKKDPKNTDYYKTNLTTFLSVVENTDNEIKEILSSLTTSRKFMVFHPSWGYFANDYNLEQIPVEVEGKAPKPRELIHLIKEAKEEKVNAVFTQPEFSDTSAKIIAKELNVPVVKVSPLSAKWSENLINIAEVIAGRK